MIAFGSVQERVVDSDDIQQLEIHTICTSRTPEQSVVLHSFWTAEPPIMVGPKLSWDAKHHFGAAKSFEDWDGGNGIVGTKNRIESSLELKKESYLTQIQHECEGHPLAEQLLSELVHKTMDFFRHMTMTMHNLYRKLLVSAAGMEYTSDAAAKKTA